MTTQYVLHNEMIFRWQDAEAADLLVYKTNWVDQHAVIRKCSPVNRLKKQNNSVSNVDF